MYYLAASHEHQTLVVVYPYGARHLVTTTFLQWQNWAGGQGGRYFPLPPRQRRRSWRGNVSTQLGMLTIYTFYALWYGPGSGQLGPLSGNLSA